MSTVFYSAFLIRTGSLCTSIFHPAVALAVSFPSVLVSSFPHTSLLSGSQHDYSLEPDPELSGAVCSHRELQ